ncbi:MAG: cyclic pyranopterin monophosphate synthase MoaC [Planctomycetaceae bacterium]|nr:cyclic pyranopterin monophosphate synthase MoaC [Planctomycetaceae bacterium]MCP4480004.1 cyclic pyranopterin monophosphate synthase MoaC [Planctomycetaceae bacterium]MCP4777496.1 cyclic pyranopterin monophosphate synthase MoaC [Planctomycetaceae bacterium]
MNSLTHFDADGHPRMVDTSEKTATHRTAVASCRVEMAAETLELIKNDQFQKGNVFEVARIAAIMASKRTPDLIPMCHPIRIDSVDVRFTYVSDTQIKITGTVKAVETTGTEMEAITAVGVGAMVVYDMCKSVDRGMRILEIQLEEKSGGKSGHFQRNAETE